MTCLINSDDWETALEPITIDSMSYFASETTLSLRRLFRSKNCQSSVFDLDLDLFASCLLFDLFVTLARLLSFVQPSLSFYVFLCPSIHRRLTHRQASQLFLDFSDFCSPSAFPQQRSQPSFLSKSVYWPDRSLLSTIS